MNFFSRKEEGKDERTIANFYDLGRDNVKVKIEALAVFKSGLEPQWEDKVCGKGGIFIYWPGFDNDKMLSETWEALIQSLVGGIIPNAELICGVRLVDKGKNTRFEIWTVYHMVDVDD